MPRGALAELTAAAPQLLSGKISLPKDEEARTPLAGVCRGPHLRPGTRQVETTSSGIPHHISFPLLCGRAACLALIRGQGT